MDANDKSEVEYLHQQYPHLKHQQVVDAVKSKGPYREVIKAYLETLKG